MYKANPRQLVNYADEPVKGWNVCPCDYPKRCVFWWKCKRERLACGAFLNWYFTGNEQPKGKRGKPARHHYKRAFPEEFA